MILDRTWNKKTNTLTISYIDKMGNRKFFKKEMKLWKTYEYDTKGVLDTWNGRKCSQVFKDTSNGYEPNEFDILEYMFDMNGNSQTQQLYDDFHALNYPKIYAFDIETKYVKGDRPNPEQAPHEVTTISLVGDRFDTIVYGWKPLSENGLEKYKQRVHDYMCDNEYINRLLNGYEPKVMYHQFKNEDEMLIHFFTIIIPKIGVLAGWNSWRFDILYLINRLKVRFGEAKAMYYLKKASPTGELGRITWKNKDNTKTTIKSPAHSIILDYQELVERYDTTIKVKESMSLDWISGEAINAHKIKYDGDLDDLYNKDYDWYVFYNAVDSILVQALHHKMKSIKCPCANSADTFVGLMDAFGQVALTTANLFWEFYMDKKHVVYNPDEIDRTRNEYEGAFCGCVSGPAEWCVCDDFASLYPSMVRTCNFSFENLVVRYTEPHLEKITDENGKVTEKEVRNIIPWTEEELNRYRKDKNYFVSVMGTVYLNDKDYAFRRMQTRLAKTRNFYKYNSQALDRELLVEIDRLIAEKKKEAA